MFSSNSAYFQSFMAKHISQQSSSSKALVSFFYFLYVLLLQIF